ncbi:hypothetical protein AB0D08_35065 [Kitasatospora sp. NPDC048540]|uniref:hypothetical protein n=1 Tax=unclassified Kitasatospora TaxID=2633591 RepID=UPI000539744F|nr:hypothetical protein [Kitasatospora sp. MBT63]
MTGTKVLSACDTLKRLAEEGRREIAAEERQLDGLRDELVVLEGSPGTTPAQLALLRQRIAELDSRLETDRIQQSALEEEIQASCG